MSDDQEASQYNDQLQFQREVMEALVRIAPAYPSEAELLAWASGVSINFKRELNKGV